MKPHETLSIYECNVLNVFHSIILFMRVISYLQTRIAVVYQKLVIIKTYYGIWEIKTKGKQKFIDVCDLFAFPDFGSDPPSRFVPGVPCFANDRSRKVDRAVGKSPLYI